MKQNPSPAEFLVRGLALPPLDTLPEQLPTGTRCALTGLPIREGYSVHDITTGATAEFLDHFHGDIHGYVSETAARCYKAASPRKGNPTARSVMVFEDGTYYNPFISAESASKSDTRGCWSERVREVWPSRAGQRVLVILTTNYKKRLWPRARVGALGSRTPVYLYDDGTPAEGTVFVDWPRMLEYLEVVETIYTAGFPKAAIRSSLLSVGRIAQRAGLVDTIRWEAILRTWRGTPEFDVSVLVAQKGANDVDSLS